MKNKLLVLILAALAAAAAFTQEATTVYVEGGVDLKVPGGNTKALDFGDPLKTGDTVITQKSGRADLELTNKSTIVIRPNTVFTLQEVETAGQKQTVLSTAVGAVTFKLNKFSGNAPAIRTNSYVAGVRGTELTVYAGMDGSSLLVVTEGEVLVEAEGQAVSVLPNEAVEVRPGEVPGQKFAWLGRELDFKAWNEGKTQEFLRDPVATIEKVEQQLITFKDEMQGLIPAFNKLTSDYETAYAELKRLVEAKETEKAEKFRNEVFFPLTDQRATVYLNIRYYALSFLSMRRFVVSTMYATMKSLSLGMKKELDSGFLVAYKRILSMHEEFVVPRLSEQDI